MCFDHKPKTKACHAGEDVVLWCGEDVRCVLTKTKAGCLLPCKGGMWWCIWRWSLTLGSALPSGNPRQIEASERGGGVMGRGGMCRHIKEEKLRRGK